MSEIFPKTDFEKTLRPLLQASFLPPYCYTSEAFHQKEIDRVFLRSWLCIGRVDQIEKPGDYFTLDLFKEPLVVVRNLEGEIRVLTNVCRHRATEVVEGSGNRRSFQCPYHLWTYDLDGSLIGAPEMEETSGFKKSDCRLPSLKTEIWEGFIFINFDDQAEPLTPKLAGVSSHIERYKLGKMHTHILENYHCDWDWKLMMDNFMEFYHVMGLHKGTHDPMPVHLSSAEEYNGFYEHSWGMIPDPDGTLWSVTGKHCPLPSIEGLDEKEQHMGQFYLIYPNLLFFLTAEAAGWYRVLPRGAGKIDLRIHMLVPPSTQALNDFEARFKVASACLFAIHEQDMWACRSMQRGVGSRMAPRGRLCKWERPVHQIARYMISNVLGHEVKG